MNLRISNIYYFLLTFRYICFSAHGKDIHSILKSKRFISNTHFNQGIELFWCKNIKLKKVIQLVILNSLNLKILMSETSNLFFFFNFALMIRMFELFN